MLDTSLDLPDGRSLAYTDLGNPEGAAVLYFHGAPTNRHDLVAFDDTFVERGLRVISPDRPGYGRSSPRPGRHLEHWPQDVVALADHLRLDRFAVIGYSSGGPYAVATAALLADRVGALGIVAGVTDMGWAPAWDGYDEAETALMRLGDEAAAVAWCEERYGVDGSAFFEGDPELAAADLALLEDEVGAMLFANLGEAFRQGVVGYAHDVTVQGRPWAFDPGTVTAPATIRHGLADTIVPVTHSRHTAGVLPQAELLTLPDHGHLSIATEIPRLAADLVHGQA